MSEGTFPNLSDPHGGEGEERGALESFREHPGQETVHEYIPPFQQTMNRVLYKRLFYSGQELRIVLQFSKV